MNSRIFSLTTLAVVCFLLREAAHALPVPESTVVTGTSTLDATGRPWLYVAWLTTTDVPAGRAYAVFTKPGQPDAVGNFTQREIVQPVSDQALLSVFLKRADALGASCARWIES
ncbi:MAG: hypothetical protein WCN98_17640, partial [Verrucomicrobiaceae bacterium]